MPLARFSWREDPSRVAEALANVAADSYRALTGSTAAELHIRRHQRGVRDLGPHGVRMVQRCGRDRPSFVLDDPDPKFYFYAACGMLPHQSECHQTLRGICKPAHAAASLLHAATNSMDGFVLRHNLIIHDPETPKAATAHARLFRALFKLGVEIQPPVQQ